MALSVRLSNASRLSSGLGSGGVADCGRCKSDAGVILILFPSNFCGSGRGDDATERFRELETGVCGREGLGATVCSDEGATVD